MGLLFIFSAYVKMVDPYGFGLKLGEYFVSFGMNFMEPAALPFGILAICAEFVIGWALLLNIQMKITAWALLAFMIFFTLLTFWLAFAYTIIDFINTIFGTSYQIFVVTDCGCFGDFIKLTNMETFVKNVIFMVFTLIIFVQRKKFRQYKWYYLMQWLPILLALGLAVFVQIYCLKHEPWHDFRPWKVGKFIAAEAYSQAPEMDFVFVYQNKETGEQKEITMEQLSAISEDTALSADLENNYTYLDRKEKIIKDAIVAKLADFAIIDINTKNDIKNNVMLSPEYTFIIMVRDVKEVTALKMRKIKALIADLEAQGNKNYVLLTGSFPADVEDFKKAQGLEEQTFYFCDMTPLKTAIRNNPGVIMLKEGYVMDKWAYVDVPTLKTIEDNADMYAKKLEKYKQKQPPLLPGREEILPPEETQKQNTEEIIQ
jgi:hypothetical protein